MSTYEQPSQDKLLNMYNQHEANTAQIREDAARAMAELNGRRIEFELALEGIFTKPSKND